ncbi:potassium/proton antiporter [Leptospira sp. GIMC2001]|uniref:potassium/proton antiporter n=1 Tax=Leptospira sp. GIMC2001 TaxID=1513297 RepID=UPI002349B310|nr:potassium/proton antiporter [Leptospira sp. GIMC2001]WCL49142.1 potassium/proton antiporter [Leptospira sp. GIMC2001]
MNSFEVSAFALSFLILLSIMVSKLSFRFGIPTLLLFLLMGMLAGSEGIGKIDFNDYNLAQSLGVVALSYILLAGGMETEWKVIRPVLREGIVLSTFGVVVTATAVGFFSHWLLGLGLIESLLLGSVVSSTDAASVFNLLRTSGIGLKGRLKPLLELESGSNDPMAVILTLTFISLLGFESKNMIDIASMVLWQVMVGAIMGLILGKLFVEFVNKINLEYDGLYTVIILATGIFIYSATTLLNGNGFLAVYLAGLYMGNRYFVHKKSIIRFMDGMGWLMQIVMFLTLGLLVFPSELNKIALPGVVFSIFLIFIARPLGVMLSLSLSSFSFKERIFISWVGLRGAAPIILATFPLTAGVPNSGVIFNLVFFTVLSSLLIQGSTIKMVAKFLKLDAAIDKKSLYPFEFENRENSDSKLEEYLMPFNSPAEGRTVRELQIPEDALITLICRGDNYIVPTGRTQVEGGDVLLILVNKANEARVAESLRGANLKT